MRITSPYGLCIVFFAARGLNGEDIFDPSLPKRTGIFKQYHSGAISCYHISYCANTPSGLGMAMSGTRSVRLHSMDKAYRHVQTTYVVE